MKCRHVLAAAAAFALSFGASAQQMKPGLWEITTNMKGAAGGQMAQQQAQFKAQMASMTPEQKKMMQEMMAKHGVQMGAGVGGGQAITSRQCMTKEMVERNEMPSQQGGCTSTKQQKTGNTMKFTVTCPNPPSTGEGTMTFVSSEAYTLKMVTKTTIDGKPETMDMDSSGKWLSADCGSVKPPAGARK